MTNELLKTVENKGVNITPHYKFSKNRADDQFITEYFNNIKDDPSYESYWKHEIIRDMKETTLSVSEDPLRE